MIKGNDILLSRQPCVKVSFLLCLFILMYIICKKVIMDGDYKGFSMHPFQVGPAPLSLNCSQLTMIDWKKLKKCNTKEQWERKVLNITETFALQTITKLHYEIILHFQKNILSVIINEKNENILTQGGSNFRITVEGNMTISNCDVTDYFNGTYISQCPVLERCLYIKGQLMYVRYIAYKEKKHIKPYRMSILERTDEILS